jgi:type II secretory pathway predicted ATPase ExeA
MYLEFFNLIEKPFNYLIPDPRYFFYSPQSQSIKQQCDYIVSEKSGHLFISGPIGAGECFQLPFQLYHETMLIK